MQEKALLGIVLFPLLGAIANGLLARSGSKDDPGADRKTVHWVACLSVAASFALALYCCGKLLITHRAAPDANPTLTYTAYEWFSIWVGERRVPVQVRFLMDALSSVMTLVVTGIGLLIHIYSTGYMSEEKSFARFFSYLNLFTASMLILILGSNLPLMFVGWEGVGLCSYLLIGFWWENPAYAAAGRKAFVANRIGDFGVLIGMFLLVLTVGSFEFADINERAGTLGQPLVLAGVGFGTLSVATAATLFLFLGCTGKSAQIPLFVWLPDAMAGPTPVSALIHAATMVTSGIYLVCRMSPVFAAAPTTMAVIAVIGALTALLAATIGCVQNDIKKVLAYSTVSQLGFMFAGAGCGAFAAGIFHVYTHAFFKACLFLGAGSVMHAVGAHGDADIRRLGGLRKVMPRTHATFLVSCLAIAGVPLFSGFFSKDEILVGALSVGDYFPAGLGHAVFALLVLAATMTAFYMFRLYFMTFAGEYRGGPEHHEAPAAAPAAAHAEHAAPEGEAAGAAHAHDHGHGGPHESPTSMTIPLLILGAGAAFAGYVWVGLLHFQPWVDWLAPALGAIGEAHHEQSTLLIALGAGVLAAAVGIGLSYSWYARPGAAAPGKLAQAMPGLHRFLMDKWRVDELYEATVLRFSRLLALVSAGVDKYVVDAGLTKLTAEAVRGAGFVATRLQNGLVQAYAAMMVAGVLAAAWWFTVPHVEMVVEHPDATSLKLEASRGLGYEYRWDFGGDGTPDTDWSPEPNASHEYGDADFQKGLALAVFEPAVYAAPLTRRELRTGERWALDPAALGPNWQREPGGDDTPPLVELTKDGLVVRRNGARLHRNGNSTPEDKVILQRGESIDIGRARVTAAGLVHVGVHVRNAFGVERMWREEVALPDVGEREAVEVIKVAEAAP
jgi:NADH-quinone oxidoreductase subunit L